MQTPDILDIDQLAVFLGTTPTTIYGYTRERADRSDEPPLPHFKLGRKLRFRRESVLAWLAAKEAASMAVRG